MQREVHARRAADRDVLRRVAPNRCDLELGAADLRARSIPGSQYRTTRSRSVGPLVGWYKAPVAAVLLPRDR
eukprot:2528746-Rhodomonas_salina.1